MDLDLWRSYLYLYAIGGLIFIVPIITALSKKSINMKVPQEKRLIVKLFGIYFIYMVAQGLWNYWAIHSS